MSSWRFWPTGEVNGTISKTRMALRKLRGGKVGIETPFNLRVVDMGFETMCVVDWKEIQSASPVSTAAKNRWPKSLRVFKSALETAIIDHGKAIRPYGSEGPEVRAVAYDHVRSEFMAAYPADGDGKAKGDAKRAAFNRALKDARTRELIGSRESGGVDQIWLVAAERSELL